MNVTIEDKKKVIRINSAVVIAIVCLLVIGGTFNSILSYGALLISVAAIVFFKEEDALCLLIFIMPFANIFKSSPDSQSFFTYILLFYVLWNMFKRKNINISFVIALLSLVVFLVFQIFISVNILRTIKFIANICFIYLVIGVNKNNDRVYLQRKIL